MQKYTNAQILDDIRRVFKANGDKPFTRSVYERSGKISKTTVENRFGSWTDALKKAGVVAKKVAKVVTARKSRTTKTVAKTKKRA